MMLEKIKAWLKAMRGGHQARSHEEAAKRGTNPYEAENKAKDEAAKAKKVGGQPSDNNIKAGPG